MKSIYLFICFFCSTPIWSQNKFTAKTQIKVIPNIMYNPSDLLYTIRHSFSGYNESYLEVESTKNNFEVYSNRFGHRNTMNKDILFENIDVDKNESLVSDSLFFMYFDSFSIFSYKHLGVLKNNQLFFYKNKDRKEIYPIYDYIVHKFGSIDKFKDYFVEGVKYDLDLNARNGLITEEKDKVIDFLDNDYKVCEKFYRTDTTRIINKFIDLISSFTLIEDRQKELIGNDIRTDIVTNRTRPKRFINNSYFDCSEDIKVMNNDVSISLVLNLTKEQYLIIIRKLKINSSVRYKYLKYIAQNYPKYDQDTGYINELILEYPAFSM